MSMIQAESFQPTGDPRKDYMAYAEISELTSRTDIINSLKYFLAPATEIKEEVPQEEVDSESDDSDDEMVQLAKESMKERKAVASLNNVHPQHLHRVQVELRLRNLLHRVDAGHADALAKAITKSSYQFVTIQLVSCGLGNQGLLLLSDAIPTLNFLRSMDIEMNPIQQSFNQEDSSRYAEAKPKTYPFASPFAVLIKQAPKCLKHISFRSCDIDDVHITDISKAMETNSTLISLNLFGNTFTDAGCSNISDFLKTNQKLKVLDLALCSQITDQGVKLIADGFKQYQIIGDENLVAAREKVYKSFYGDTIDAALIPPSAVIPVKKSVSKPKGKLLEPFIAWESGCTREVEERSASRESKTRTAAAKKAQEAEPNKYKVTGNMSLESLNLSLNRNLTDESVNCFVDCLGSTKSLQKLRFTACAVSPDALEKIAMKLNSRSAAPTPLAPSPAPFEKAPSPLPK